MKLTTTNDSQRQTKRSNEREHTPIQTRILIELHDSERKKKLNTQDDKESQTPNLSKFDWTNSTLEPQTKQAVETVIVELDNIVARQCFDSGFMTRVKVQVTALYDRPAYSRNLHWPINLKGEIPLELSLLHKWGINTNLHFSRNVCPIFAKLKPDGKLRPLADLRKIKNRLSRQTIQ